MSVGRRHGARGIHVARARLGAPVAGLLLAACGGEQPGAAVSAPGSSAPRGERVALVTDGYADDTVCVECHRDAARGFAESGMSRSFGPPATVEALEPWNGAPFHHEPSDRWYEMSERGGRRYVKRYLLDPDGQRYAVLEQEIHGVIGSGAHSRSYVYRNEANELFQMPVAWYAETGAWGIHPGFDHAVHEGFQRRITRDCMACHNAYPEVPVGSDVIGQPHVFPPDLPHGIGCQRCHGAGAEHVRLADDPDAPMEHVVAAIANAPRLPADRAEDVCLQCHLQPASRLPSRMARFGRGAYGFRVGERIADAALHLDFGDEADQAVRFESNHQAYRLDRSRCRQASGEALTCTTCHDPHHRPAPAERAAHYRAACRQCHEVDACGLESMGALVADRPYLASVGVDDCVACHMPRRRAHDVVGEIVHDHAIERMPPATDPTAPRAEQRPVPGVPRPYMPEHAPPPGETELYLAVADVQQKRDGGLERLAAAIAAHPPEAIEPWAILGEAYLGAGRWGDAVETFTELLRRRENLPVGHVALGRGLTELGRADEALAHFDRAIALERHLPEAHFGRAVVLAARGDAAGARSSLEEALRLRPHYADALANLARLDQYAGAHGRAATSLRRLIAVDPDQAEAYLQLGLSLLYIAQLDEAVRSFERGRRRRGTDPRFVEALAMGLAIALRFDEAERAVTDARALRGADEAACLLVDALVAQGRGDVAAARARFDAARRRAAAAPPPADVPAIRAMLLDAVRQVVR